MGQVTGKAMALTKHTNQRKALLLALLAVLFWSTMSSAFKITLRYIDHDQLLLWTSLFGMMALFILNRTGKSPLKFRQLTRKHLLTSALLGFLNPFLYYLVLFKAYDMLEAQIAGTLNYIWPITLVLLSIPLLGQKIKWMSIAAIFISFFGLIIISTRGDLGGFKMADPVGVILAVGSSVFWALYWIINLKDDREEVGKIMLNLVFGCFYILVYLLLFRKIEMPAWEGIAGAVYIGLFEMSITFVIWLKALQFSINTAKVSNLIYLSPFIALFWIRLTVGEYIYPATVIGLAFVVAGIILQQFSGREIKR
jgi:drug/metabolite transporter (DMT)-like permease